MLDLLCLDPAHLPALCRFGDDRGGVWTLSSPYLCNALFFTASLLIFYLWVRPGKRQILRFVLLLFLFPAVVNHIFSGMAETLFCSFCIILYAVACKMARDDYGRLFLVFVYALISYIVIIRPYYLLFYFIPFWYWRKRDLKKSLTVTVLVTLLSVAAFFVISYYFIATANRMDAMYAPGSSVLEMFITYFRRFFYGWRDILRNTKYYFVGKEYDKNIFLLNLIAVCIFLWTAKEFFMDKKVRFLPVFSLAVYFVILSFFALADYMHPAIRHVISLTVWMICVVAMEMPPRFLAVTCAVLLYFYVAFYPNTAYPYGDAAERQADAQLAETLASQMELEDGISWNNTVVWTTGPHRILYFLPAGFGIDTEWSYNESETLPPRKYVLSARDPALDAQLAGTGRILCSDGSSVLYER